MGRLFAQPYFFLSHQQEDASLANDLTRELRRLGGMVVSPSWELEFGGSLQAGISEVLRQVDVFLVLVTDTGDDSRWIEAETRAASDEDWGRNNSKILIVRFDDARLPPSLAPFRSIAARSNDLRPLANDLAARGRSSTWQGSQSVTALLESELVKLGATVSAEPDIAGVQPDLWAVLPDGTSVVFEVKNSPNPSLAQAARARTQAQYIQESVGADQSFAVFPELSDDEIGEGIMRPEDVSRILGAANLRRPLVADRRKSDSPESGPPQKTIFVAMPFDPKYNDTFFVAIVEAAKTFQAVCVRVDEDEYNGDIPAHIRKSVEASDLVIADLSDANPNVLYETGLAHALGKPTVHICATTLTDLPLDIRNWNTISYEFGNTHELKKNLEKRLSSTTFG